MSNHKACNCGRTKNESEMGQRHKLENYLGVKIRSGCFEDKKVRMAGRFLA